jgi:hypothetical protein
MEPRLPGTGGRPAGIVGSEGKPVGSSGIDGSPDGAPGTDGTPVGTPAPDGTPLGTPGACCGRPVGEATPGSAGGAMFPFAEATAAMPPATAAQAPSTAEMIMRRNPGSR